MRKHVRIALLATLLVALLALTAVFASAATIEVNTGDNLQTKINGATAGDTIYIVGNLTSSAAVTVNKDLTFAGTGSVNFANIDCGIVVSGSAHLTVSGGSFVAQKDLIRVKDTAKLTVSGGRFESQTAGSGTGSDAYTCLDIVTAAAGDGAVTITGGTFIVVGGTRNSPCMVIRSAADVNITGGTFSFVDGFNIDATTMNANASGKKWMTAIEVGAAATLNISGGNFYGGDSSDGSACIDITAAGSTVNISDMTAYAYRGITIRTSATVNLAGGTFHKNPAQANGGVIVNMTGGNGTVVTVSDGHYMIGDTGTQWPFTMSANAGKLIIAGGTFETTENTTQGIINANSSGTSVEITGGRFIVPYMTGVRMADGGMNITITGGTFEGSGGGNLIVRDNGTMTISGGTFAHTGTGNIISGTAGKAGTVSLQAGVTLSHSGEGHICYEAGTGTWTLTGLTVNRTGAGNIIHTKGGATFTAKNVVLTATQSAIVLGSGAGATLTCTDSEINSTDADAVAANGNTFNSSNCVIRNANDYAAQSEKFQVGNTKYSTLSSALAAIQNGGTLTILVNTEALNFNVSKTFTVEGGNLSSSSIKVSAGTVTLKNINVSATGTTVAVSVTGGKCTIQSGRYTATDAHVIYVSASGTFTMSGGTVTAPAPALEGNEEGHNCMAVYTASKNCTISGSATITGTMFLAGNSVLTINNGVFHAPATSDAPAHWTGRSIVLVNSSSSKLVINGGNFSKQGGDAAEGIITLNDSNCTAEIKGGKFTVSGVGHLIRKRNGKLTITGGTFTSTTGDSMIYVEVDTASVNHGVSIKNSNLVATGMLIDGLNAVESIPVSNCTLVYRGTNPSGQGIGRKIDITNSIVLINQAGASDIPGFRVGAEYVQIGGYTPIAKYAGNDYYVWMNKTGSSTYKPQIAAGASVRLEGNIAGVDNNGIRFTTTISGTVIAALEAKGTLSFGTLIAPADYVAAAGGFTHKLLSEYADGATNIYADVVAVNSLRRNDVTGDVSFNAALIGIKTSNIDRQFAAVSYVKVNNTYYYSDFNSQNTRSIKEIVGAAWADDNMVWITDGGDAGVIPVTLGGKSYAYAAAYTADHITNLYNLAKKLGVYTEKHEWVLMSTVNATCAAAGQKIYRCNDAGCTVANRVVFITKLQHSYKNGFCTSCGHENGDFEPVLRFAITSDVHVRTDGAYDSLKRLEGFYEALYAYTESRPYDRLDGIFFAGDYTHDGGADNGTIGTSIVNGNAMKLFFEYVNANTKDETLMRAVLGNHEFYYTKYNDGTNSDIRYSDTSVKNTNKNHSSYSGTGAVDYHDVIGGFHFIGLSMDMYKNPVFYSDAKLNWLQEQLAIAAADDPTGTKPIFVYEHVGASGMSNGGDKNLGAILEKYPQVVNFNGHSHTALSDPRTITMGGFISINTGSLANLGVSHAAKGTVSATDHLGSWTTGADIEESVRNGYLFQVIEVDADNKVRLVIYDYDAQTVVKVVNLGNVGDTSTYRSNSVRKGDSVAPAFASGAAITPVVISSTSALLKIPQATANVDEAWESVVSGYTVKVTTGGSEITLADANKYRLSCAHLGGDMPAYILAPIPGLTAGQTYTVTVTPINYWGKEGTPLTYSFNTANNATGHNTALFSTSFGANGKATNAYDGTELRPFGNATTVYDSSLGRYVASLNTGSYNFDNMSSLYDVLADGMTVETYFKLDKLPPSGNFYPVSNQESGGFGFQIKSDGKVQFLFHNGTEYKYAETGAGVAKAGTWMHLVGSYDGSYVRLYVNGVEAAKVECTGLMQWPDGSIGSTSYAEARYLCIGGDSSTGNTNNNYYGGTELMTGKVANVSLYGEALTASEITALYNTAKP